jgi:glycosyltransferase involved in cell wall biosynthesis
MRILLIVHRFHPNLFYPVKSLVDYGYVVALIVPKVDTYVNLIEDHSILKPIYLEYDQLNYSFVNQIIASLKPDLIIQRYFSKKWKYFWFIGMLKGVKCISYEQNPQESNDLIRQYTRPFRRLLRGEPLRKFTPVLNKGRPGRFNEPFSTYIPFPIEQFVHNIDNRTYFPKGIVRVLCVGKLGQKRKNHLQVLNVLESLDYNVSLSFVGAGPSFVFTDQEYFNELQQRCNSSPLKGGVSVQMDFSYSEMVHVYLNHDILVFPAVREDHGQAVLEALSAGCVVIATDDCGAAGYIVNDYSGKVYERNNTEELKAAIRFFLEDPNRILEYSAAAIQTIRENHSGVSFANAISKLVNIKKSIGAKNI